MGKLSFIENIKIIAIALAVIYGGYLVVSFVAGSFDENQENMKAELQKEINNDLNEATLLLAYGKKIERQSSEHINLENMVLDGNLTAAYVLAWQHASGFKDGKADYTEAIKLLKIAMPKMLPDTFFLLSVLKATSTVETEYALLKMGLSFDDTSYALFKDTAKERIQELEPKLTTSQKLQAKNLMQSCKDKKYTNCIK